MTVQAVTPLGPTKGQGLLVTAATVRREGLEPLLDAQALNDRQAHQLANLTEACDCAADHLNQIAARPHDRDHVLQHVAAALSYVTGAFVDNAAERAHEQRATGLLDPMVTDLRRAELQGTSGAVRTRDVSRVARRAPDLLAVMSAAEIACAARVLMFAPAAQLLAPAVQHEVGRAFEPHSEIVDHALKMRDAHAVNVGAAESPAVTGHAAT